MKTKLKTLFTHNWRVKALILTGTFLLWVYVSASQSLVIDFPGQISVNYQNTPDGMISVSDIDSVQIKIATDPINLKQLKEDNFSAFVDLKNLSEGTYEKEIVVNSNREDVKILSVKPQKTTLRLEKKITKTVPVRAKLDGQAANEYIASDASTDIEEVEILGPESIVQSITEVVAPIKLNGESQDFQRTAKLFAYSAGGNEIKNITIKPNDTLVSVKISPSGEIKTIGIKVQTTGSAKAGYWVSSITTDPAVIIISGSRTKLAQTKYLETEDIDISNLAENKTFSTKLIVPSGLKIEEKNSQIKVEVGIGKIGDSKELKTKISFSGLQEGLRATSDPTEITVLLIGSKESLDKINPENIKITIPLTNMGESGSEINITRDMLSTPDDISIGQISPEKIRVNITKN